MRQPYGLFSAGDTGRNKFKDLYVDTLWLSRELLLMDRAIIRSTNYASGSAGFKLNYDGTAEFNSVTLYGSFATGAYTGLGDPYIVLSSADRNTIYLYTDLASENTPNTIAHTLTGSGGTESTGLLFRSGTMDATNDGFAQLWMTGEGADAGTQAVAQLLAQESLGSGGVWTRLSLSSTDAELAAATSAGVKTRLRVTEQQMRFYVSDVQLFGLGTGGFGYGSARAALIKPGVGSVSTPDYTFTGDLGTGIFNPSTGAVSFAGGGVLSGGFDVNHDWSFGSGGTGKAAILNVAGSLTYNTFTFQGDINTGMLRPEADLLVFSAGGAGGLHVHHDVNGGQVSVRAGNVSYAAPAYGQAAFMVTNDAVTDTTHTYSSGDQLGMGVALNAGTPYAWIQVVSPDVAFRDLWLQPANGRLGVGPGTYNATTGAAADVVVAAAFPHLLWRYTSARKYKSRITYNVDYLADYELKPTKHYRKDDKRWFYSFIADDLGEQDKLLGTYEEGEIEGFDTAAVLAVMAAKINRLEKRLTTLTQCGILLPEA